MAAELIMAGPGQPVTHTAAHDLESLYYVLIGICVLFNAPYTSKSDQELEGCFDKYFNTYSPSLLKTTTIQSILGWEEDICTHISPYFQPLIPLLESLREILIVPIRRAALPFKPSPERPHRVTHLQVLQELENALVSLPDGCWQPQSDPKDPVVDPVVEYSLRRSSRLAAADAGNPATSARNRTDATDTDEPTTTDSEPGPAPVLEDGHLVYPRFPRPPNIRAPSGPGFEHQRVSTKDDDEYEDIKMPPSKRPRSTSRTVYSKSRHLARRPLPANLRNKTTSYLKQRSRKAELLRLRAPAKGAGPAVPAGESSSACPLSDVPDDLPPLMYIRAQTEPMHHDTYSDSDAELEGLRSSSLTPNPTSESD